MERRQDADRRVETGRDVALGNAGTHWRAARLSGDAHDAAHSLHDDVERGPVAIRPRPPEPGSRRVDKARVTVAERVVAEAQLVHRARSVVLHHYVGFFDEAEE